MAVAGLVLTLASVLPLAPAPAPPFPKIITDAPTITDIAPGISYGEYRMLTVDGPLSVHVVAVDLHDPSVHIGAALAEDRLVSHGETVSSMAHRAGAVAGINGDYFDINQTNQPLNILVENGQLIRMPMQRWAIAFERGGDPFFSEFAVAEDAVLPDGTLQLKTMNDWPPPGGGAVFITPEYGALHPVENVTEIALQPAGGTPPFTSYRVTGIVDNTIQEPPGYYLAIGPNAYGSTQLPNDGDTIAIEGNGTPSLDGILTAIGGGPLLVKNGAWFPDSDGPSKGEFLTHMPASAVAITRNGTLLLLEIDGRQPALSIGVLQPQLASLLIAFGAVTGMQFDGGGSSTIVARMPGEVNASVQNSPSDGVERRVADALLVYSDAPYGPPARIYSAPQVVRALPGARVPLHIAVTDAGGHAASNCSCEPHVRVIPSDAGTMDGDVFIAGKTPKDAVIRVTAAGLQFDVPVHVTTAVARTEILPLNPAMLANETLQLQARAYSAHGYPIAVPERLHWTAERAEINDAGLLHVGAKDAAVSVALGDAVARQSVTVGEHNAPIALQQFAIFSTAPHGGPGGIAKGEGCPQCTTLRYDFTGTERAAYVDATIQLPQRALGISADVYGDGNGETLRLAVNNAINERFLYTIAKIDWHGWRHVEFRFPPALPQPITFKSLYVINRVGPGPAVQATGAVSIRDLRVVLAGSATEQPK